jgi:DNA-binding CsgD family transcriptional regulator
MKKDSFGDSGPTFPSKDLAQLWRIPFFKESDPSKIESALYERIKELNCLYGISQLAERHMHSVDNLLQELVNFLPYSWQFPDLTCARIMLNGKVYVSEKFEVTDWRQSSQIYMFHEAVGEVVIFYLKECPPSDEGPFLKEERALLDAVAEQIGTIATRISAELASEEANRQLILERQALQESNIALRTVLSRIEQEKQEIYKDIKMNVEKVIEPILNAMLNELPPSQTKYVELIQSNMEEITSPFINRLSRTFTALTPTEITISNMIKSGMRTKEIASLRGVSESTINRQREKIRQKLKITNEDVNLATFLQSNMDELK